MTISYSVSESLQNQWIKVCMAICEVQEVINRRNQDIQKFIESTIATLDCESLKKWPIIKAYKSFYGTNPYMTPAESLYRMIQKNWDIPNINTIVDIYNTHSVLSSLSLWAHDTDHITWNIRFDLTTGNEYYVWLFKTEPETIPQWEYACIDDEKVLCRMDIKQCDQTKITKDTKKFILYVQGNKETSNEYCHTTLLDTCKSLQLYLWCSYQILPYNS
jgi:DNA/RNA-binding domain of Phe-tRNA-synthetase-like protein